MTKMRQEGGMCVASGNGRPTIEQVAKLSNTSKTTVSRYLNQKYEYMSEATKQRIQEVIEELGYRPNNFARSLRSRKSGMIGVLIADISTPFSSILLKGIGDLCEAEDYQMIIVNTDEDPVKERRYLQSFVDEEMVDGIIANTTGYNEDLLVELSHHERPIVLAERAMKVLRFDTVTNDNYNTTLQAMRHMTDAGFERVAFFTQPTEMSSSRQLRLQGYLDYCQSTVPSLKPFVYVIDTRDGMSVVSAIEDFNHQTDGRRRSIFAVNGVTSLAVLQGFASLGLRIPDDVGFCGYDDWDWAPLIGPGITTIGHPSYDVGKEAARCLIARIKGEQSEPRLLRLPSSLHVRGSTKLVTV